MTPQIVEKIEKILFGGVTTEAEVVYVLAGVRKIMEQEALASEFPYLEFHCNWALHSTLRGNFAQKIIREFDAVHPHLMAGGDLPNNSEAYKISGMDYFEEELESLLERFNIRDFFRDRNDWTQFLYLYTQIIMDSPLKLRADTPAQIKEIVVSVEANDEILRPHRFFKVSWRMKDLDGKSGEIYVLHSYEKDEPF